MAATDLREVVERGRDRIAMYEGYDGEAVTLNSVSLGDFRALLSVAAAAAEWAEADAAEDALYAAGGRGQPQSDELTAAILRRDRAEVALLREATGGGG